jgi:hypothetical protein
VFAHIPPGSTGYIHGGKMGPIITLRQICDQPESNEDRYAR